MRHNTDIIIVGGGMAGGMLATLLAGSGLDITVLDAGAEPRAPAGEPGLRVSALTAISEALLRHAGAWDRMDASRRQPYHCMEVRDGDGSGELLFRAADAGADHLGTLVENDAVAAALYQCCQNLPAIHWQCHSRVQDLQRDQHGWALTLAGGERFHARLLVGADGARSMVRSRIGLPARATDTGHVAIVATLRTEQCHEGCARQSFLDSGPMALLPLHGDGRDVSLVWSVWPERATALMALDDRAFARELSLASQHWLGELQLASARAAFPIHDLHAGEYVVDGAALIGDAAHVVHPLAGQGINLGLLDAAVLAEEMLMAREQGRDWHSLALLQRYQRRRRGHNGTMVTAMRGFKFLFEQRAPWLRFVRNAGMSMLDRHHLAKGMIARQALGRFDDVPRRFLVQTE